MIIVYNAESGVANTLLNIAHKSISPNTYACQLCKLTHGVLNIKTEWNEFIKAHHQDWRVMHKDEFEKEFSLKITYPAILDDAMNLILKDTEINDVKTTSEMIELIKVKLINSKG